MFEKSILYSSKTTMPGRGSMLEGSTSFYCLEGIPVEDYPPRLGILAQAKNPATLGGPNGSNGSKVGAGGIQQRNDVQLYAHGLYREVRKYFEYVSTSTKK